MKGLTNDTTISAYSANGSSVYEDPMNKNFLYGKITTDFLDQVDLPGSGMTVLDIGCGTGFAFDHLQDVLLEREHRCVGIEPSEGMRRYAHDKYDGRPGFEILEGSFESIPLEDESVDKIVSTLALHWVKSLDVAAREMRRVLKSDGSLEILMIARDDGARFKRAIVNAQKKHLTFAQVMKTATLVQRARTKELEKAFSPYFEGFDMAFQEHRGVVYGDFDEHMKWWKARSAPVIADVEDKEAFMADLSEELEKIREPEGIPFDTAYFWINIRGK